MDTELHAVRYAFDAAFQRMCEAETDDALMAELSNLLHHLYRLRMLCTNPVGKANFYAMEKSTPDLRSARGASWARNADTHELYAPAALQPGMDIYVSFYTAMYGGILVWKPWSHVPLKDDSDGRSVDYEHVLEGNVVLVPHQATFARATTWRSRSS